MTVFRPSFKSYFLDISQTPERCANFQKALEGLLLMDLLAYTRTPCNSRVSGVSTEHDPVQTRRR
jgi:hypothetical protein